MIYTVKKDLELCEQFKLTPMQLMFLKLYVDDPNNDQFQQTRESKSIRLKFQTVFKKSPISVDELADLIARDILIDHNEHGEVFFDLYELSGKWRNKLRLSVYPMPAELFDAYPLHITVQNKKYLGRNASETEIAMNYLKNINNDPEEHKKVIEDVKWGIDNNQLNIGLRKFVDIKYWLHIREMRKEGGSKVVFSRVNLL